jgi:hypothetical protein
MANAPATQGNVELAMADYNVLRPQKSGTDTMAAITQKYGTDVANAVRAQVATGAATPIAPATSGPAQGAYGFANVSPTITSSVQGDFPRYAPPNSMNTRYSTSDQAAQAANPNSSIPLVGWAAPPPQATGIFGSVASKIASGLSGGTTYYTQSSAWQRYVDMPTDQRIAIQNQLLASGYYTDAYYGSGTTPASRKPSPGAIGDIDTFNAFQKAFGAAQEGGVPLDQILGAPNAAARNAAQVWQQNTQVGQVTQTSPEEIHATADAQAVAILGRRATADEKALLVSLIQGKEVAEGRSAFDQKVAANRSDLAVSLAGGIGAPFGATGSSVAGGGSPASVNALVAALGGQETTSPTPGGYTTVNPDSGAAGRFQIMPDNWPKWSAAAGLGANAPMTPANQEIVARNQISLYLKDGNGDASYVAVAWYAGEEVAKAFQADPSNPKWQKPQMSNGKKYPSIADYAKSVVGKVAAVTPGTLATQSMAGQAGGGGLSNEVGSINVGQGTIPTAGSSLAGEVGSIGATAGAPGATGLTGTNTASKATSASGQPTLDQLLPTSFGVYTSVNPTAEAAAALRKNNPQGAGAHDIATVLDAVHALFHGSGS